MKKIKSVLLLLIFFHAPLVEANENIIFSGTPIVKITEAGINRVVEKMTGERAMEFRCVISKVGKKYYWLTRENNEVVRITSGAYETFIALNGSGYVRTIPKDMKGATSLLGGPEGKFDYVEHLLLGLRSVTYYGNATK
jgi:hypothetical protein|tara:strand:- start:1040 stop:1456 length:417 start_codon:yes stop_codon:yes gene_type:complete